MGGGGKEVEGRMRMKGKWGKRRRGREGGGEREEYDKLIYGI